MSLLELITTSYTDGYTDTPGFFYDLSPWKRLDLAIPSEHRRLVLSFCPWQHPQTVPNTQPVQNRYLLNMNFINILAHFLMWVEADWESPTKFIAVMVTPLILELSPGDVTASLWHFPPVNPGPPQGQFMKCQLYQIPTFSHLSCCIILDNFYCKLQKSNSNMYQVKGGRVEEGISYLIELKIPVQEQLEKGAEKILSTGHFFPFLGFSFLSFV